MSKNKQTEQGKTAVHNKPTPQPAPEQVAAPELAIENLAPTTNLTTLPTTPSARPMRQAHILRLQRQHGNAYVQRLLTSQRPPTKSTTIQPKLEVNEPNDQYEQEADAVADAVMRAPSANSAPPTDPNDDEIGNGTPAINQIQRAGTDPMAGAEVNDNLESRINSMQGGGAPLPSEERTFFENRMGADFSDVRVHTGSDAVETSRELNARAYTTGSDIAFNDGEYQPGTESGRSLLAHELTHTIQQGGASTLQAKVQRREDAPTEEAETDTPTPEEKAAAEAAAAAAEAIAAEVRTDTKGKTTTEQGKGETTKAAGEAPKQEAEASKAQGPVNTSAQKAQEQQIEEKAITSKEAGLAEAQEKGTLQIDVQAPSVTEQAQMIVAMGDAQKEKGAEGGDGGGLEAATTTAQAAVESAFGLSQNPPDKAPESAEADPTYQTVSKTAQEVGKTQQLHEPAQAEADQAQAAAISPAVETDSKAETSQVGQMEQAETPGFDAAAFKAALMARIAEIAPKSADEADNFKENDGADAIKSDMEGQVKTQKDESAAPLEEQTTAAPDTGSVEPKPVTPLESNDPGALPPPIGAETAVPKPKGTGEFETPLQTSNQALDQQLADAEITEEQLANSNEPEFVIALENKDETQKTAQEAPQTYRAFEQEKLTTAEADAVAVAEESLASMHSERTTLLADVDSQQGETKTKDEEKRAEIAGHITGLYDRTKTKVEEILNGLDTKVNEAFDAGAAEAAQGFENFVDAKMEAYKEKRYGGFWGWAKWGKDKLLGMPEEVNTFYTEGRQLYIDKMDAVIDNVTAIIGTTLAEAKAEVAKGKQEIQTYVEQLPSELQGIGQEAQQAVQSKFDQLEQNINDKQGELINTLAQKYQENLQAVDARIEEMKEANRGLVDKAIDAIGGVITIILELKNMLLEVLASAADAVMSILADPIGFVGNLIEAVGNGLKNFATNILTHLQTGFVEWLTGTMGEAGITMPEDIFSLEGVLDLVLQVLGLTWENFRARAVGIFGDGVVSALETGFEIFLIIKDEGLIGLWEWIQDKIATLKDEVIEGIKEMIATEVIEAGVQWLIGILGGPAGAFIKAAKAIYDIIMWFVNNASQVMALVQSIIDSVAAIASGSIEAAAEYVENSLANFIPVAIGFLASLLGLGDLSKKVRKIIDKVQEPVNDAIDFVLDMIKGFVMKIAKMLGVGGDSAATDGQIGEEIPFTAGDESHKLYVDVTGSRATLMVASEPMTVEERLADWTNRASEMPEDKQAEAQGLLGQARSMLGEAEESADFLAEKKEEVKKVDDGDQIQAEQSELEGEQRSLADILRQLFEIFGDAMPELEGDAKIKFDQIMADQHIPESLKAQFQDELFMQLTEAGEGADQYGIMKGVAATGDYFTKGPDIPLSELEAHGGMTRVVPLKTIWADNLDAGYKAQFGTFESWLEALGEDISIFNPDQHLDGSSTLPGRYASAWWSPRDEQQGNTMAELIEELALNPGNYEGGCVRATTSPQASQMSGFKKPTALDGIFFMEFAPAPDSPWGITGGGSLEAVAPKIAMSDITEKEFLPSNLPEGQSAETTLKTNEEPLLEDGKITKENAERVASTTAQEKNIQITVKDGGETWNYDIQRMASPKKTFRPPANRHFASGLSIPKSAGNSLFDASISQANVTADVNEINNGIATQSGDRFNTSSGRIYGYHDDIVFPISGPGIVSLSSQQYKLLKSFKKTPDKAIKTASVFRTKEIIPEADIQQVEQLAADFGFI